MLLNDNDCHQHQSSASIVDTKIVINEQSSLLLSNNIVSNVDGSRCSYNTTICIPNCASGDGQSSSLSTSSSSSSLSSMGSKKSKKGDIWFSIYLMFYISYLVLGSVAFQSMEVNTEVVMRQNFRDARATFLQKYSNVMGKCLNMFLFHQQNI